MVSNPFIWWNPSYKRWEKGPKNGCNRVDEILNLLRGEDSREEEK